MSWAPQRNAQNLDRDATHMSNASNQGHAQKNGVWQMKNKMQSIKSMPWTKHRRVTDENKSGMHAQLCNRKQTITRRKKMHTNICPQFAPFAPNKWMFQHMQHATTRNFSQHELQSWNMWSVFIKQKNEMRGMEQKNEARDNAVNVNQEHATNTKLGAWQMKTKKCKQARTCHEHNF